jgi:hypothetical protein
LTREIVAVVLINAQNQNCSQRGGCGRRALIVDVLRTPAAPLKFCASCLRELAALLFHAAAK